MKRAALFLPVLALAACSQQSSKTTTTTSTADGNTTATTTTSETSTGSAPVTAAALGLQPGKWETTVTVTDMEMNGIHRSAPAGLNGNKVTSCVTPEMAIKGPDQLIKQAGIDCTTSNVTYADGKISGQRTCKTPMGEMTSVMTGTYSPTESVVDADATVTGRMTIKEKIHTEARRIGDCG